MDSLGDIFDQYEAEAIAYLATPEGKAEEARLAAALAARAESMPEVAEADEPTTCEMCGDDLDDGECPSCDAD